MTVEQFILSEHTSLFLSHPQHTELQHHGFRLFSPACIAESQEYDIQMLQEDGPKQ